MLVVFVFCFLLFFASDFCQTYGTFLILCQSIFSFLTVYFSEICIPISCIFFLFKSRAVKKKRVKYTSI